MEIDLKQIKHLKKRCFICGKYGCKKPIISEKYLKYDEKTHEIYEVLFKGHEKTYEGTTDLFGIMYYSGRNDILKLNITKKKEKEKK